MDFFDVIEKRYSVRAYRPDPVEDEKLNRILEAARLAPTAVNSQPFQILVIHTAGRQEELRKIYHREWFVQPPLILGLCGIPSAAWVRGYDRRNYMDVDLAIVMDHIVLSATALGLGTCFVAAFNVKAAREILNIPEDIVPLLFTPLGYAADQPPERERKQLNELVRYERW
jgi:nitroreductase